MNGPSASDTRAATTLDKAITAYREYLKTGIPCRRSVPNVGNMDCIKFTGVDAVAQLQKLRQCLHDALSSSDDVRSLAPTADQLATNVPSPCHMERGLNYGVMHVAESMSEKPVPFAEYVRADVLDILDKALARLKCAFPAVRTAHSGERVKRTVAAQVVNQTVNISNHRTSVHVNTQYTPGGNGKPDGTTPKKPGERKQSRKRAKRTEPNPLTKKQQEAIDLKKKEGKTVEQVGSHFGITKQAASRLLQRAEKRAAELDTAFRSVGRRRVRKLLDSDQPA